MNKNLSAKGRLVGRKSMPASGVSCYKIGIEIIAV